MSIDKEIAESSTNKVSGNNSDLREEILSAEESASQAVFEQGKHNFTEISRRIDDVIKERQGLADIARPIHQHLTRVGEEILELEHRRKQLLLATADDTEVVQKLREINFDDLKHRIGQDVEELEKLIRRFSRPTLNIGVVGRMRQGKSTFLKSLSGLTNSEIPAREGGACTAVRSRIFHHDGELEATAIFHSKNTFMKEVIEEYYRELNLGPCPNTLEEFAQNSLPSSPKSATHQAMYERLRDDYHETYQDYQGFLKDGLPRQVPIVKREDIPKFVAQERDQKNRLVNFEHLAVREVEIRCRFPKLEVYKLGLIDVPGLGDTRVGDEKLILKTLEQEVDVVIFFRKPDFDGYQWEVDDFTLYDLAEEALENLSRRAFLVLNHRKYGDEDNFNGCNALKNNTQSIKVAIDPFIADCSSPDDANAVLGSVVDYLDKNIAKIELQYFHACQGRLLDTCDLVNSELGKAQNALISYVGESRKFEVKFRAIHEAIAVELIKMLKDLSKQRESIDTDFEAVIKSALQQCENDTGIYSVEAIEKLAPMYAYGNVYEAVQLVCAVRLRAHLSKNFLALDEGLHKASDRLRSLIADVFIQKGGFSDLALALNVKDIDFLAKMRQLLEERQNKLELGFRTLLDFKMSYGPLIMESIRKDLETVIGEVLAESQAKISQGIFMKTPNKAVDLEEVTDSQTWSGLPRIDKKADIYETNTSNISSVISEVKDAALVHSNLKILHQQAIERCKYTLADWAKIPSRLRYYMAAEFIDRVLYDEGMEEEWRHFLSDADIRTKVWIEFKQIEERKQIQSDWQAAIERVRQLNQRERVEFNS